MLTRERRWRSSLWGRFLSRKVVREVNESQTVAVEEN